MLRNLLLVFCVLAIGCAQKPEDKLIGTWTGFAMIQRQPTGNASLDQQLAAFKTRDDYSLELKKDATFTETVKANNVLISTVVGAWTLDHGTLILTPKTVNGKDPADVRAEAERMTSQLQVRLPLPEGTDGPRYASVSSDFKTIQLPSVGAMAELKKAAK